MATTGKDKGKRGKARTRAAKGARKRAPKTTTARSKARVSAPAKPPAKVSTRKATATTASAKPARERLHGSGNQSKGRPAAGKTGWGSLGDAAPRKKKSKLPAKGEQRRQGAVWRKIYPFQSGKGLEAGGIDDVNPWVTSSDRAPKAGGREEESRATPEAENVGSSDVDKGPESETPAAASPETRADSRTDTPMENGDGDEGAKEEPGKTEETTGKSSDAAPETVSADADVMATEDLKKQAVEQIHEDLITDAPPKKKSRPKKKSPPEKISPAEREPAMTSQQETKIPIDNATDAAQGPAAKDEGAGEPPPAAEEPPPAAEEPPPPQVEEPAMKQAAAEKGKKATRTETKPAEPRVKKGRQKEIPVENLATGVVNALGNGLGQVLDAGQLAALGIVSGARASANVVTRLAARVKGKPNGRVDGAKKPGRG